MVDAHERCGGAGCLYSVQGCVETRSAPTGAEGLGDGSGKPETEVDARFASKSEAWLDGVGPLRLWTGR